MIPKPTYIQKMIAISVLLPCLMSMTHTAPASNEVDLHFKDNLIATSILRTKRQTCQDGTYQHEGITCCLCAAGQYLEKHCIESGKPWNRTCVYCKTGETYSSDPNKLDSCEPCTSCDSKASLEVKDHCTIFKDTVCQCQQNHFCDKGPENCKACYPCKICGNEGNNIACTATNDTICNDIQKTTSSAGVAFAVIFSLAVIVGIAVCVILMKKKKKLCWVEDHGSETSPSHVSEEMKPLQPVDLSPHLHDIAKTLGWKVMKEIAVRSQMKHAVIESHELNHPSDVQEAAYQLLKDWVEKQGKGTALNTLIKTLHSMDKKYNADEVMEIVNKKQ